MTRILAVTFLVLSFVFPLILSRDTSGAGLYAQRDMMSLIQDGKGKITVDKIDIGEPEHLFDGALTTLVRSESINPFTATLILDMPMKFDRVRLRFTRDTHEWTLETADNEKDLNDKARSWKKIVDNRRSERSSDIVVFDDEKSASAFRLTVRRLTGDDYVHIFEWEFPVAQQLKDLEIMVLNYAPRDTSYKDAEQVFENTVLTLMATAIPENGPKLDVSQEVNWQVQGADEWMQRKDRYLVKDSGKVKVTAEYGGMNKTREITVIPPMDYRDGVPLVPFQNDETDLDVLFIERLPRIDFDGPNGGWPEEGSTVTWRAHIRNWGNQGFDSVTYKFIMNGNTVSEGVIENFEPETVRTVDWDWRWHKSRQRIGFEIDIENAIGELSKFNNRIEDYTDALAVGFYVEEYLWRILYEHQHKLHIGSNSFEDWAQRQIREWNRMHTDAVYPSTPQGVIDRVRLDRVVVVPNNSLPMSGGLATNNPDNRDKTVDLIWGFESNDAYNDNNWRQTSLSSHTNVSWGHMHELNHARYIIDSYGFDIHPNQVEILLDDGTPIVGSKFFPRGVLRYNKYKGLMGGGVNIYDEYMALAWNHIAGKRARGGNYNAPTVIGEYLQLRPEKNIFSFTDEKGNSISGAEIWIYRSIGTGKGWYDKFYDNTVDMKFTLDENGITELPWTMFAEDGVIRHTYGNANSKVIIRVNHDRKVGFDFIEVSDLNMEYMGGYTDCGHYTVRVKMMDMD